MGYCSEAEVIGMIKEEMQSTIIGDRYLEDNKKRIKLLKNLAIKAIEDADAEINGYLARRYSVPLARVPAVINKFSKDIAVYNLISRMGIEHDTREKTFKDRYDAAITYLTNVAKGIIEIGLIDSNSAKVSATGFTLKSNGRLFNRNKMRGW